MSIRALLLSVLGCLLQPAVAQPAAPVVETAAGAIEGAMAPSGIHTFKGIPYAAPPVGERRWQAPHPAVAWDGVLEADGFGPQCMQPPIFGDMMFRADGMSEDCLYLNVWTPDVTPAEPLPVLVYFYGGGFVAGDGSEPRYDGESMAEEGIVAVTLNYRLGAFGFLAHPELTAESPHASSSNYGLLDQAAALQWVHDHIAAFGGDPDRVTIAGESAGSASVSAQVATPLARGLIAGAIGESGSFMGTLPPAPLAAAEQVGLAFADSVGAASLAGLRALPAEEVLEEASAFGPFRFRATIDGYFFPKPPAQIYAAGEQAQVPLLLGWNSEEMNYRALLQGQEPTPENYENAVRALYGPDAEEALRLYPGATEEEVIASATDLAGDRFIGFSTWKWFDLHRQTGDAPVYRYYYTHPRPPMRPEMGDAVPGLAGGVVRGEEAQANRPPPPRGAVHSAEIEYAMGNLDGNPVYAWTDDDYAVSEVMQAYFANFVKTGDPNGPGLPTWPAASAEPNERSMVMVLDVESGAEEERHPERYRFLDQFFDDGSEH